MMKPMISYIICSMPRSGTHLLGEALQNTGRAGKPDEYFICDHDGRMENETGNIANLYGKKSLEEFHELVLGIGSTPNGVFGITIMGGYLQMIIDNFHTLPQYQQMGTYELLNALFYCPKYIWLVRRDKVKQAISIVKALQTGVWKQPSRSSVTIKRQPKFNFVNIEHYRNRVLTAEKRWEDYFHSHNITPFQVVYEDLVANYEQTALDILNFLNISPDGLTFGPRQLHRQADSLSSEWLAKYQAIKLSQVTHPRLFGFKRQLANRTISLKQRLQKMLVVWNEWRAR